MGEIRTNGGLEIIRFLAESVSDVLGGPLSTRNVQDARFKEPVMEARELMLGVHSLHRYFIWANRMREHFYDLVPKVAKDPERDRFSWEAIEADLYMSFWYGELYVVIEGWKELGLSDGSVGALLASPNVELLRRYRNGVFHFQAEYFDERFLGFIRDGENAAVWVGALNRAFGAYFLRRFAQEKSAGSAPTP